jgi:hypothetical protein
MLSEMEDLVPENTFDKHNQNIKGKFKNKYDVLDINPKLHYLETPTLLGWKYDELDFDVYAYNETRIHNRNEMFYDIFKTTKNKDLLKRTILSLKILENITKPGKSTITMAESIGELLRNISPNRYNRYTLARDKTESMIREVGNMTNNVKLYSDFLNYGINAPTFGVENAEDTTGSVPIPLTLTNDTVKLAPVNYLTERLLKPNETLGNTLYQMEENATQMLPTAISENEYEHEKELLTKIITYIRYPVSVFLYELIDKIYNNIPDLIVDSDIFYGLPNNTKNVYDRVKKTLDGLPSQNISEPILKYALSILNELDISLKPNDMAIKYPIEDIDIDKRMINALFNLIIKSTENYSTNVRSRGPQNMIGLQRSEMDRVASGYANILVNVLKNIIGMSKPDTAYIKGNVYKKLIAGDAYASLDADNYFKKIVIDNRMFEKKNFDKLAMLFILASGVPETAPKMDILARPVFAPDQKIFNYETFAPSAKDDLIKLNKLYNKLLNILYKYRDPEMDATVHDRFPQGIEKATYEALITAYENAFNNPSFNSLGPDNNREIVSYPFHEPSLLLKIIYLVHEVRDTKAKIVLKTQEYLEELRKTLSKPSEDLPDRRATARIFKLQEPVKDPRQNQTEPINPVSNINNTPIIVPEIEEEFEEGDTSMFFNQNTMLKIPDNQGLSIPEPPSDTTLRAINIEPNTNQPSNIYQDVTTKTLPFPNTDTTMTQIPANDPNITVKHIPQIMESTPLNNTSSQPGPSTAAILGNTTSLNDSNLFNLQTPIQPNKITGRVPQNLPQLNTSIIKPNLPPPMATPFPGLQTPAPINTNPSTGFTSFASSLLTPIKQMINYSTGPAPPLRNLPSQTPTQGFIPNNQLPNNNNTMDLSGLVRGDMSGNTAFNLTDALLQQTNNDLSNLGSSSNTTDMSIDYSIQSSADTETESESSIDYDLLMEQYKDIMAESNPDYDNTMSILDYVTESMNTMKDPMKIRHLNEMYTELRKLIEIITPPKKKAVNRFSSYTLPQHIPFQNSPISQNKPQTTDFRNLPKQQLVSSYISKSHKYNKPGHNIEDSVINYYGTNILKEIQNEYNRAKDTRKLFMDAKTAEDITPIINSIYSNGFKKPITTDFTLLSLDDLASLKKNLQEKLRTIADLVTRHNIENLIAAVDYSMTINRHMDSLVTNTLAQRRRDILNKK